MKLVKFKAGDKVWIERTEFVESVDLIRNVQTVDYVVDVPTDGLNSQVIYLVGSRFMYGNNDLKLEMKS